jgi:glutamine amidotransferase
MIAIIDYGVGNLRSVQKGFERVGFRAEVTREREKIVGAAGVVLPGVGAFGACMEGLRECGLVDTVYGVVEAGVPFLGICVGMQILFSESVEFGRVAGLGILAGRVVRFRAEELGGAKIPHMGWNRLRLRRPTPLLAGVEDGSFVYFVHSYYPVPDDQGIVAATTSYGPEFASVVACENVFACQFHPEKSQAVGLKILANFGRLAMPQADAGVRAGAA